MAVIDDIRFTRREVTLHVAGGDRVVVLEHEEAVELAAALLMHVAIGPIDAGEVVDPGDELSRIARSVAARAVDMMCEALPRLEAIRRASAAPAVTDAEAARLMTSGLGVHDGGGEATAPRPPELEVVRG